MLTGTIAPERGPILVADSNLSRRHSIRTAFEQTSEIIEVDALRDNCLSRVTPSVAIVGRLGTDSSAAIHGVGQIRTAWPRTPMVVIADPGNEELAVAALRARVTDYLQAPVRGAELISQISKFLPKQGTEVDIPELVGKSPAMQEVRRLVAKLGPSESTVLITGETGTGKELVAHALHARSQRADKSIVPVNCAAIPETLVESELFGFEKGAFTGAGSSQPGKLMLADGGTAFLDEVGDMSSMAQAKVLRALESREISPLGSRKSRHSDVRFIAATNQDLEKMMKAGQFRADLFYRLNVVRIHLYPLRYRVEDIPELVAGFLRQMNARLGTEIEGVTPGALELLQSYNWPGNVRELRNVIEFAVVMATTPYLTEWELRALEGPFRDLSTVPYMTVQSLPVASVCLEPSSLVEALQATNWNKSEAAKLLHLSRTTLYRKMARYRHNITEIK